MIWNKVFKVLVWLLWIATSFLIVKFALETGQVSSERSGKITEVAVDIVETVTKEEVTPAQKEIIEYDIRKILGHFLLFAVNGFSTMMLCYFYTSNKFGFIVVFVFGLLLSICSEFLQSIPEGRGPSINDVLIDYSGYVLTPIVFLVINLTRYFKRGDENA